MRNEVFWASPELFMGRLAGFNQRVIPNLKTLLDHAEKKHENVGMHSLYDIDFISSSQDFIGFLSLFPTLTKNISTKPTDGAETEGGEVQYQQIRLS